MEPPGGGDETSAVGNNDEPGRRAFVRTFLIADVRGYTKYTQEHGDQRAAELAATFADLVRDVVEAGEGSLLELRGDEALVVFLSARQALRAAVDLQERFARAELPRGVGIGLDSGEAIPVGDGYRGGALNLAARLCAQAKAGEILASEAVIHLAARVEGLAYVDPRMLRLKGYAEPVRAAAVVPSERAHQYGIGRRIRRVTTRLAALRSVRIAVAAAVLLAVVAVLLPEVLTTKDSPLLKLGQGLALLDPRTGHEINFISSSVVKNTAGDIYADGHYWVWNTQPNSFLEIDAKTGKLLTQIASPVENVGWYGVSGNDLWVTAADRPTLVEIDIPSAHEVNRFTLSKDPNAGLQGGLPAAGSIWVSDMADGEVLRVDPVTGKIQHRFHNVLNPGDPVYGDGSIWVSGGRQFFGLNRIDPATNTLAAHAFVDQSVILSAAGGGFGWTSVASKGTVYKVDRGGNIVSTYQIGDTALGLSFAGGVVWACNQDGGSVTGINATTGHETIYRFGHPLHGLAAGSGTLLVDIGPGQTFAGLVASMHGKVATLLNPFGYGGQGTDPAVDSFPFAYQVEFATCAMLVNYPDKPSPSGWRLQPEVAAAMPAVSADRRTYTFTVRSGYRFSPPSSQPVTAETFRYSIERALSPKLANAPGPRYLDDIQGEQAFRSGKADHISGLQADGTRLTVALTRPSPDFLQRLTMPFFCPVPTDTPIATRSPDAPPVASAGPYYLAHNEGFEYTLLRRNPNYAGSREHRFDVIAIREGVDPVREVQRVESGAFGGVISEHLDPVIGPDGPVASRWGPQGSSTAHDGQRYYTSVNGDIFYLALNTGRPLLSDRRVRQAVAYALDRPVLAKTYGFALPTDQLLPPNIPNPGAGPVFPTSRPDLAKAKRLMDGGNSSASLVVSSFDQWATPAARAIKAELAPIGIDVRIKVVQDAYKAIQEPGARYDMMVGGDSVAPLFAAAAPFGDYQQALPPRWLPAGVGRALDRLQALPTDNAARAFITGLLKTEVPVTGLFYGVEGNLFAPQLGCRVFPPASAGVDLAAICPAK